MEPHEIEEFLYYEYDQPDPKALSSQDKHVAYTRLKHKLIESNPTPDEYTKALIRISEYLEL